MRLPAEPVHTVMEKEITEITRRAIFDALLASDVRWAGRLAEDDFLSRIFNLAEIPSTDRRIRTAAGDIRQHRVVFRDWDDDWVFYDSRFNLLHGPDDVFLRFLCETVHPAVRPDTDAARQLVEQFNRHLGADGWQLIEGKEISGNPCFVAAKSGRTEIFDEPTGWAKVDRQMQEVRLRLESAESEEQCQAVGLLCREALISAAQESYDVSKHGTVDGVRPSETDAKRMLESIFKTELAGGPNEEARSHAKAALQLALALQHKRTATFRMAALCAEATASVVNLLAILAGRRGRLA